MSNQFQTPQAMPQNLTTLPTTMQYDMTCSVDPNPRTWLMARHEIEQAIRVDILVNISEHVKRRIQRELDRTEIMETEFYQHQEYAFLSDQEVQQRIDKRLPGPGESLDYPIVL